jgi:putative tricarboxylic transport membrane protein
LPLVGLWVQLLRVPFWILGPAVRVVSIFGTDTLRNSWFDVGALMVSGVFGYVYRKANLDCGPLVMAFILADILDTSLRQSLLMGDGNLSIMFLRPISAVILGLAIVIIAMTLYSHFFASRKNTATSSEIGA